jgi:hypothetical protein
VHPEAIPTSIHPEVDAQHDPLADRDQEVLPARIHPSEGLAHELVTATVALNPELSEGLSVELAAQLPRQRVDRVSFGHPEAE